LRGLTANALRRAHSEAADPVEREHVTPFLYRRPERFVLANMRNDLPLGREGWTVDTPDDLAFVRRLVDQMGDDDFPWRAAWAAVGPRATADPGEVQLVPAGREHSAFFLACRNDEEAVRHSRTHRPIARTEHARWFSSVIDDPGVRMRVAMLAGEPVGTIRVEVCSGVGEVGVAVAPTFRGRGLGTALLESLLDDVATDPQVVALTASVHTGNTPSMRAFARVGFHQAGADGSFRLLRHDL